MSFVISVGPRGAIVLSRPRITILTAWIAVTYSVFAYLYHSADSYTYLIPTFLCFAIWIGIGTAGLIHQFGDRVPFLGLAAGLIVIGYFVIRSLTLIDEVDASHDLRAESFGREILSAAPENAILFAKGDQAIFTLWYFHFALGERPDIAVVASDLLHFDWYLENLHSTYPSLIIPNPFPWPESIASANPYRSICSTRYFDRTEMQCAQPWVSP